MDTRIGTCSECGGPVVVPSYCVNPTPHCQYCGAIPRVNAYGPVIPMTSPKHPRWSEDPYYCGPRPGTERPR